MKKIVLMMLFVMLYAAAFSQKKDTLTTSSGLKYVKLKDGKGTTKPKDGQTLKVKYSGKLMNGKKFDSGTFEFVLGKKEVIPGWDEGFKLMNVGEKGVLIVPSKLGYGKKGSKDDDGEYIIPPDADMIFEVELVSVK